MRERVTWEWASTHGEKVMRGEWKPCRVCGSPTNLGPVCCDYRCEYLAYQQTEEG